MAIATGAVVLILLLAAAAAAPAVNGVEHIVGGNAGWSLTVNYSLWAAGQNFTVKDTLFFKYNTTYKVDKVNQTDYNSCNYTQPLQSHSGGNTTITLSKPGEIYFICPLSNYCAQGMKLAVNVNSTSGALPAATANVVLGILLMLATMFPFMG